MPERDEQPPPWSPLIVTIVTLALPPGGIVVTVRNMERLHVLDRTQAWKMAAVAVVIFAVGLGIILGNAPADRSGMPQLNDDVITILRISTAILAYFACRNPYRDWRQSHQLIVPGKWLPAVGWALLFTLVTAVLATPVALIAQSLATHSVGSQL